MNYARSTNLYFFLFVCCILFFSCASSKKHQYKRLLGIWQEKPIKIDGSNKDWPSPYPDYDVNAALGYCVSNDKKNLYITVETGDPAAQLKILREGLTVWIDKTGKKEEMTAINFPLPQDYTHKEKSRKNNGQTNKKAQVGTGDSDNQNLYMQSNPKKKFLLEDKIRNELTDVNAYSLQGFKACNLEFPLLERDSCGIVARLDIDSDNEMVWEAVVPFKTFYYKKEIGKGDKGKPMSICIETTGSKKPAGMGNNGNHNNGNGGFRPGFGVGGGMGGYGGGMQGGRSRSSNSVQKDDMEQLYKSTKTYKVFGIAFED